MRAFDPRFPALSIAILLAGTLSLAGCGGRVGDGDAPSSVEVARRKDGGYLLKFDSEQFVIGRKIDSMDGPSGIRSLELPAGRSGELVWLTAIRNQAIDAATGDSMSQEFLCHSNLSWGSPAQLERDTAAFRGTDSLDPRVATLIQGQNEIELPPGFGFPLLAGEPLEFFTMVINKNVDEVPFALRVRTELEYWRDEDLSAAVVPLFRRRLYNSVELDAPAGEMAGHQHDSGRQGSKDGVATGVAAPSAMRRATLERSEDGAARGMHWMVPPGRHEYRSPLGDQLQLPFDTTVHYVTGHLHPYGESIELVDTISGETIFRLEAHPYGDRLGIAEMDSFSSAVGSPLSPAGQYELVTVYDNPTDQAIDAMGILYLYLRDEAFERTPGRATS